MLSHERVPPLIKELEGPLHQGSGIHCISVLRVCCDAHPLLLLCLACLRPLYQERPTIGSIAVYRKRK